MTDPTAAPISRREIEEKIVALAWNDDDFRRKFLADPKKQFEERLKTKLPANLKITAHAEDENHVHFVIPAKPAKVEELSDAELEKVAGGVTPVSVAASIVVTAAVVELVNIIAKDAGHQGWDP